MAVRSNRAEWLSGFYLSVLASPSNAAFAVHFFPYFQTGTIAGRLGSLLAAVDTWIIGVKGRGGDASMPHLAIDLVSVACEIGVALHTMVTRLIRTRIDNALLRVDRPQQTASDDRPLVALAQQPAGIVVEVIGLIRRGNRCMPQ